MPQPSINRLMPLEDYTSYHFYVSLLPLIMSTSMECIYINVPMFFSFFYFSHLIFSSLYDVNFREGRNGKPTRDNG